MATERSFLLFNPAIGLRIGYTAPSGDYDSETSYCRRYAAGDRGPESAQAQRRDVGAQVTGFLGPNGSGKSTTMRPVDILWPLNIEVIHPDGFLLDQLDLAPRIVLEVLREQAAHTRRPPLTPIDLITRLAKSGVRGSPKKPHG